MRSYVDIHVLQTVPPSNLNRDDAGSPKQATYGGVKRARVSSQAWKRATRQAFFEQGHLSKEVLGTRTKRMATLLSQRLIDLGGIDAESASRIASVLLRDLKGKKGNVTEKDVLLFFGRPQLEQLIKPIKDDLPRLAELDEAALDQALSGVSAYAAVREGHSIDVALFGRMIADIPALNVDAATQVAHAISTHAVDTEFDYYTAVDDENREDETGAGMIGTIEFNSSTLYRYATVGLHQLMDNLSDSEAAAEALRLFLIAFVTSMPSGHQNSFAHHSTPNLVTVAVRDDQPVNLASAFERPVRALNDGLVSESVERLADELRTAAQSWGFRPAVLASTYRAPEHGVGEKVAESLGASVPFQQVVATVVAAARERLASADR